MQNAVIWRSNSPRPGLGLVSTESSKREEDAFTRGSSVGSAQDSRVVRAVRFGVTLPRLVNLTSRCLSSFIPFHLTYADPSAAPSPPPIAAPKVARQLIGHPRPSPAVANRGQVARRIAGLGMGKGSGEGAMGAHVAGKTLSAITAWEV
jgi:hypothetical protein